MLRYCLPFLAGLYFALFYCNQSRAGTSNPFFQDKEEWFLQMAKQSRFPIDTSAVAVVLYEKCVCDLEQGSGLDNMLRRNVRRIIKVLRKGGVSYGDFRVLVPAMPGSHVEIRNVKGTTYKLNGTELASLELNADNLAKNKTDFLAQVKGSMPGVEEGAVLDISYSITLPAGLLFAEWEFQHPIPTLYSELETWVPAPLAYYVMSQGSAASFAEFDDTKKGLTAAQIPQSYNRSENLNGGEVHHERWVRRNVAAITEEPMAPALSNFEERIQLRVNMLRIGPFTKGILDNWKLVNNMLYGSFSYYQQLEHKHTTVMDKTDELTKGLTDPMEKAKTVYGFVRNSFHADGYTNIYLGDEPAKVLKNRSGSPSEINFLLILMMRYAGIPAEPAAIATNDQRGPVASFPDINQFNRTICQASIGGEKIFLDASEPNAPFGSLPRSDYNGYARLINSKEGSELKLDGSTLNERSVIMMTTEKADPADYVLNVAYRFGMQEAQHYRSTWQKDSTLIPKLLLPGISKAGMDAALLNYKVDGLYNPDTNLTLSFRVRLVWPEQGKAYFNPHIVSPVSRNPFVASKRVLPVELPAMQDAQLYVQLRLPDGYKLEEAPKPAMVKLNNEDYFKYLTAYDAAARTLQINARIHAERTWYPPAEYDLIKQFYEKIVAQQETTYVFSK